MSEESGGGGWLQGNLMHAHPVEQGGSEEEGEEEEGEEANTLSIYPSLI